MTPPFDNQGSYYSQAPQVQQHEIGRIRQFIMELEYQQTTLHTQMNILSRRLETPEDQMSYIQLLNQYNQNQGAIEQQAAVLKQMLALLPVASGRQQTSDQVKREIYHLYHASRYTQEALASQYGISQSSVQRIVTGPPPPPLNGVNTASLS